MEYINILISLCFREMLSQIVLSELEKHIERESSFRGNKYKTVDDLIVAKKRFKNLDVNELPPHLKREGLGLSFFSTFKVVNRFKVKKRENSNVPAAVKFKNEQHGRPQKRYHIIIDAKYIKMIVKRSYRAENLYDFFKNLYQLHKRFMYFFRFKFL